MLVVVRVVRGMAMLPVQVVHVVFMAHSDMSAVGRVNVHVGAVRKMRLVDRLVAVGQLIDMVVARRVHVSVMEVVHVVIVWHGRMTAPLVVDVVMVLDRRVVRCRASRLPGYVVHV
jgi:hypothetical protein